MMNLSRLFGLALLAAAGGCASDPSSGGQAPDASADASPAADGGADAAANAGLAPGFQIAAPWPAGGGLQHLSMAVDERGDPMLSYVHMVPGGEGPDELFFTRYDRATGAWTAPVLVDGLGDVEENDPFRETSVAFDATTKRVGIAYQGDRKAAGADSLGEVRLALSSDGGKTFTKEGISVHREPMTNDDASDPVLALAGGAVHLAYVQNMARCWPTGACRGGFYVTRAQDGAVLTRIALDVPAGTNDVRSAPMALELDVAGKPGLAYFVTGPGAYEVQVAYARPGSAAELVATSANIQNDVVSVSLAFAGTKPRLAHHMVAQNDAPYDMRFSSQETPGGAWTTIALPRDGTHGTARYQSLNVSSTGAIALAAELATGSGGPHCGNGPKLLRSTDGATFTACGTDDSVLPAFAGRYVNLRAGEGGKLVMSFVHADATNPKLARGIALWREP